jgi:hypothetical protein
MTRQIESSILGIEFDPVARNWRTMDNGEWMEEKSNSTLGSGQGLQQNKAK